MLFVCLGHVHLGIFILMVQKSCWPAGPSSQMSCRSYAKVVGLGPTDRREFPTLILPHPHFEERERWFPSHMWTAMNRSKDHRMILVYISTEEEHNYITNDNTLKAASCNYTN